MCVSEGCWLRNGVLVITAKWRSNQSTQLQTEPMHWLVLELAKKSGQLSEQLFFFKDILNIWKYWLTKEHGQQASVGFYPLAGV